MTTLKSEEPEKAAADKVAADNAAAEKAAADKAAAAKARPTSTSCGGNVSAGGTTSCSFALNVANAYMYYSGGTTYLTAYSPVTQEYISMHCVAGVPVVCRGGRAAVVYIR